MPIYFNVKQVSLITATFLTNAYDVTKNTIVYVNTFKNILIIHDFVLRINHIIEDINYVTDLILTRIKDLGKKLLILKYERFQ